MNTPDSNLTGNPYGISMSASYSGPAWPSETLPPTIGKLVYIERQALNYIIEKLLENKTLTLTEAILEVQQDSLWWTNELAPNNNTDTSTTWAPKGGKGRSYKGQPKGGKGRGKYQPKGRGVWQNNFSKGRGKGKGKGKRNDLQNRTNSGQNNQYNQAGQTRGANGMQPKIPRQQWIKNPRGTSYCENYHVYGTCQDGRNCTREHTCPGCGRGIHPLIYCRNC